MKSIRHFIWIGVILGLGFGCKNAANTSGEKGIARKSSFKGKEVTVGFYNVENLFDTEDNPQKIDEDFLPSGKYKWTHEVYQKKLENIATVIADIGSEGPELMGIAEVENAKTLTDLAKHPKLSKRNYQVIHQDSPDMRGIDCGFIYDPGVFQYIRHQTYEIYFPEEPDYTSRLILLVEGTIKGEKLFVFVNHWPSRYGGQEESESRRVTVAKRVRKLIDEILVAEKDANIMLMGDFNDDPHNRSLTEVLGAKGKVEQVADDGLFNPMTAMHNPETTGSLTYRGKWNLFDQIIVSEELLSSKNKLQYIPGSATIHNPEFIQVGFGSAKDAPRRAIWRSEFVPEGYSDHFPVYARLKLK